MGPCSTVPIWVLGDFNNVLDKAFDKFSQSNAPLVVPSGPTIIARLINKIGLRDVWRDRHNNVQCFSCYSATYRSLSHIDLCLGNTAAHTMVPSVSYASRNISDHSLLSVQLDISSATKAKLWKIDPYWYTLFPDPDPILRALQEYLRYNQGMATLLAVWDTLNT